MFTCDPIDDNDNGEDNNESNLKRREHGLKVNTKSHVENSDGRDDEDSNIIQTAMGNSCNGALTQNAILPETETWSMDINKGFGDTSSGSNKDAENDLENKLQIL